MFRRWPPARPPGSRPCRSGSSADPAWRASCPRTGGHSRPTTHPAARPWPGRRPPSLSREREPNTSLRGPACLPACCPPPPRFCAGPLRPQALAARSPSDHTSHSRRCPCACSRRQEVSVQERVVCADLGLVYAASAPAAVLTRGDLVRFDDHALVSCVDILNGLELLLPSRPLNVAGTNPLNRHPRDWLLVGLLLQRPRLTAEVRAELLVDVEG